ncbi:SMC-Scp complex subunit ScpB [uncultured Thiothrix sp.]|uniref:SMC-Scp complex subunit ScpB n=1 Tax=uncultured Thiothrix sp. TaxID=223185 RepID=UPI002612ADEF|nr:SMC-Scp complex subunit ScpB [uncultured Thiothrix sp.]HMT92306.1 SMC-Scp complex subunit ScpB [Thiolinea sp.]
MSTELALILEAILLTANKPLSLEQLATFFAEEQVIDKASLKQGLKQLAEQTQGRSFELIETASGYRLQTKLVYSPWVSRHQEEKVSKYSRVFLETLALIAWRQPITRAEIEEIRGVAVNANVLRALLEREWVRVLGHKEVPGRPELLGTTKQFLDYFNLKSLEDLPQLGELKELGM